MEDRYKDSRIGGLMDIISEPETEPLSHRSVRCLVMGFN